MSCIPVLTTDRLRNRVTSILEEGSGTHELHQISRLYPTDFLYKLPPVTNTTQCLYCASQASCLGMRLRSFNPIPKLNMNRCRPSKEWSAGTWEDLLKTCVCIGLCLPVLIHPPCRGETAFAHRNSLEWALKLRLESCLRSYLYCQTWMFACVLCGMCPWSLQWAHSSYISAITQVLLLLMTEQRKVW